MLIIQHRANTIEELKNTPKEFGVEIDIRPEGDNLILHHDPFVSGESFEEWLKHYGHAFLILNVKSEGIEKRVIELMEKFEINNYFLLDVTPPFIFKLIEQGVSKIATRFSEFESIESCLNLKGKVEWVFIDNLTHLPTENNSFQRLRKHFKLCIVSPELLKRDEIEKTKWILKDNPVDAVLTKKPFEWKEEKRMD